MSESCEVANPFALPPVTSASSSFYLHVPHQAVPHHQLEHAEREQEERSSLQCASYFNVKTIVDRTITAVLMIAALPIMILIGLAILLLDGRPVFYRQTRVGKNGRTFRIWKFRTMCRDAETNTGAVWSNIRDPRVTTLGRWLRCSHLDELPQFFNVLMGDMNLIGPRPERPEFVRRLAMDLPRYRERLKVRPGITGLAQLHLGYDQSVSDVERKVFLDIEYIGTTNFLRDIKILCGTFPYVARQLVRMWRANSKPRTEAVQPLLVESRQTAEASLTHPYQVSNRPELEPHLVRFPAVAISPNLGVGTSSSTMTGS
jgi:lipopolysaccharide/colanic/teichoic acid biosynthesis glycosyltransferase